MKIDIRDEIKKDKIDEITFSGRSGSIELFNNTVNIPCAVNSRDNASILNEDIPNLIKALQKVCELKGIK